MLINITDQATHEWVKVIGNHFHTLPIEDCHLLRIDVPRKYGNGTISSYQFSNGISLLLFDCEFKKDIQIDIRQKKWTPLCFHFCAGGEVRHFVCDDTLTYQLNKYMGSIVANPADCVQSIVLPSGQQLKHANLQIDRRKYMKKLDCEIEKMPDKLADVFTDIDSSKTFFYQSNYSTSTADCVKLIIDNSYEGLEKTVFEEGKALELISFQLKQYRDDHDPKKRFTRIKEYDVNRIMKAAEILDSNLQSPPTIVELAKKVAVNQQKLKNGFKQVFDKTIRQYLTEKRMEAAKLFISQGGMSINEVSSAVGYSNAGYFARRFQEYFGSLPNEYRTQKQDFSLAEELIED